MKLLSRIRTYYFFFSFGFFLLSQNTLNLTYAQDVVIIIDDIESRLKAQGNLDNIRPNPHVRVSEVNDYLQKEQILARRKEEIALLK